jgi:predicted transcriptional regulator
MANVRNMADRNGIVMLWQRGWSFRRIARVLGVHRDAVSRYVREAEAGAGQNRPPRPP